MATSNHIQLKWEEFKANVLLPSNPGPIQISETRRAFWAGCTAMYYLLGSTPKGCDDSQLGEYVKGLKDELWKNVEDMKKELIQSLRERVE